MWIKTSHQYALQTFVVKSYKSNGPIGKKALQKLVFLSHKLAGIPTGYRFTLYNFGPFSRDLAADVDILSEREALCVRYNDVTEAFEITPGQNCDRFIDRGKEFIDENKDRLEKIMNAFSNRTAKELELSATLLYLLEQKKSTDIRTDSIVENLLDIKPKYLRPMVEEKYHEVVKLREEFSQH